MGCDVFANGNEVSCKGSGHKVIAEFPDVCLSPPSPPAGPVPVPYPDTSFAKDTKNGSKTVKIKKKETMLKNKSFYKSSPLGDEAATRGLGAGVVTHVITGKTYFVAWSMDVKFEGQNVDRHIDLTTSNHPSPMPNTPSSQISQGGMAKGNTKKLKCPCCDAEAHSAAQAKGESVTAEKWYDDRAKQKYPDDPAKQDEVKALLQKASPEGRKTAGCTCDQLIPKGKKREVMPQAPCDKFYKITKDEKKKIEEDWRDYNAEYKEKMEIPSYEDQKASFLGKISANKRMSRKQQQRAKAKLPPEDDRAFVLERQANHLVPKSAGGCPGAPGKDGNLQANKDLCKVCQGIDEEFSQFQ